MAVSGIKLQDMEEEDPQAVEKHIYTLFTLYIISSSDFYYIFCIFFIFYFLVSLSDLHMYRLLTETKQSRLWIFIRFTFAYILGSRWQMW